MSSNDNGKLKGWKATKCPVSLWNCVVVYEHWVVFSSKCTAGPECDMIGSGQIQSKNKTFHLKCVHHQKKNSFGFEILVRYSFWPCSVMFDIIVLRFALLISEGIICM